ncbi:reticulon-like protein B13 [Lotus japonicus]|uniref:reticulon-like protein B13 n=1 Tax=Lotus japonicus TaxID=34305 RepID=UPI00258BCF14|nr:reticulon-like protein B13 [Lotus japonicus]
MSSEAAASDTQPFTTNSSDGGHGIVKDVVLWRRKKLSALVLVAATATWALMQVFQFNFLTVISWAAIFLVASIFLYANVCRLLGKGAPSLSRLELREETAMGMGNTVRAWIEEAIRWLIRVSTEEDWPAFVRVVAGLWSLSYVGSSMDLLTFIYIGILVGMTLPIAYTKNEDRIKRLMEWLKEKYKRSYEIIDRKAINEIKSKLVNDKGKKTE